MQHRFRWRVALAAVVAAVLVLGAGAEGATAAPASSSSCLHETVSGKRRTEQLPGSVPVTVSIRSRRCFDRVEVWRYLGDASNEYRFSEHELCDRLHVEPLLHGLLGHGLLTARLETLGSVTHGRSCQWTLPYRRYAKPANVLFEGIQLVVLQDPGNTDATYRALVSSSSSQAGTKTTATTVLGHRATQVRWGAKSSMPHARRLFVEVPKGRVVMVMVQTNDQHPGLRKALCAEMTDLAARAARIASAIDTDPLE